MMKKIALGQVNTTIGDFEGNVRKIVDYSNRAADRGAELIVFPELALTGYPPQDLLERPSFVQANLDALGKVESKVGEIDVLIGYVEKNAESTGNPVHNAAAYISDGVVESRHFKSLLPSYDVFDEDRHFEAGGEVVMTGPDNNIAVTICEDIWNDPEYTGSYDQPKYERNPFQEVLEHDPELIINLSASPFVKGKERFRAGMAQALADKSGVPLLLCNLVGGNDSLVFDGHSLAINGDGDFLEVGAGFEEELVVVDFNESGVKDVQFEDVLDNVYDGLVTGLYDYLDKCGFDSALVGLSGGMDSSLTVTLAADALGPDNVTGILMPSEISSEASVTDAEDLADNLGIETKTFAIHDVFDEYLDVFEEEFAGLSWDTTEENLQARIRGNILMAMSNKYGDIVLSTGNKSEFAVGYSTLYGDLSGGLAVISDVPKTMVYKLAEHRNERGHVIPENVFSKPPSAELAPDQKDQDVLPSYDVLDEIIERYVERKESSRAIVEAGFDQQVVEDVIRRIDLNEYKRQQAPIGLKITSKSLGAGWRMPITQQFDSPSPVHT
ncbi:MAG: NAD+ synthase [bacterium]